MRPLSVFFLSCLPAMFGAAAYAQAPRPVQVAEAIGTSDTHEVVAADEWTAKGLGADAWAEIIRAAVLSAVPERSVHDKHWGDTTAVLSRYEVKTHHGRLSMRPKTKRVNHGLWQRQTVTMIRPEDTLKIEFQNVRREPQGPLTFTMQLIMRARVRTDFAHWVYGVKGLNGQAEADVTFAASTDCAFDLTTVQNEGDFLPTLQLVPEIHGLRLKVHDIDARQIGIVGGWAAEEIGDNSRSMVNSVLHEYEDKILRDLRRKIAKNHDRLRVSPSQLIGMKPEKSDAAKLRHETPPR